MLPLSASAIAAESVDTVDYVTGPAADMQVPRIRLLLITDTSIEFSGGSERFLRNLVTLLPRDRYQITLVQLDAGHHAGVNTHLLSGLQHVTLVSLPVEAIYGRGGRHAWSVSYTHLDVYKRQTHLPPSSCWSSLRRMASP